MDLEYLKSEWKRSAELADDGHEGVKVKDKSWFVSNKTAIDGVLCILVGALLVAAMVLKWSYLSSNGFIACLIVLVIVVYAFVKGVFTILFSIQKRHYDNEVNKFMLCNLKNRLNFIYERMLWLWVIIPIILLYCAFALRRFVDLSLESIAVCYFLIGVSYFIAQFFIGHALMTQKRRLLSDIRKLME